uniref:Uncharacterized protein n=1 Tax=Thermofilum pendens TaxID=2269 RepID=A0A7C1T9P7_THEPE
MSGIPAEGWDRELRSSARRLADYLGILLAVEYDVDAIDRIAKARKLEDFAEGIYNALRRRESLLQKLLDEKVKAERGNEDKNFLEKAIKKVKDFSDSDVDRLINSLSDRSDSQLKLLASYVGSMALAHEESTRLREILERLRRTGSQP